MQSSNVIRNELMHYQKNELIFASKLYKTKLYDQISEAAFYKTLERMCKSGELIKIAKGTYHLPKIGKYGLYTGIGILYGTWFEWRKSRFKRSFGTLL